MASVVTSNHRTTEAESVAPGVDPSLGILLLCHEFPPIGGGAASVCAALAGEYRASGHRPTVVTMGFGDLAGHEDASGVQIHRIPCGRRRNDMASPWEGLRWAWKCRQFVRRLHQRQRFDVTHAHFIMPAGIVASQLKQECGVPFVITPHGSDAPGYNRERLKLAHLAVRPWWRRICKRAETIVSPSASLLQLIESKVRLQRTSVIPNGYEPERFQPRAKARRILMCSRLVERKGFQYVLKAIAELQLDGWAVDIVGDGPMFARLRTLAECCQTPVTMHGWIDNDDPRLAELYGQAMIFVFPSEWENFSIALLEAMGAGCAVIATNVAGNPEVIGKAGYLVAPRDIGQLRRAILELTCNPHRCIRLGTQAAERALGCFSWKAIAARYLDLLRDELPRGAKPV